MHVRRTLTQFIKTHYRHLNAAVLVEAAEGYRDFLDEEGKVVVSIASGYLTQVSASLAEMIHNDKVHALVCTEKDLESSVMELLIRKPFRMASSVHSVKPSFAVAGTQKWSPAMTVAAGGSEIDLLEKIKRAIAEEKQKFLEKGAQPSLREVYYSLLLNGALKNEFQIDLNQSALMAAAEKNLPLIVSAHAELQSVMQSQKGKWGYLQIGEQVENDFVLKDKMEWNFICKLTEQKCSTPLSASGYSIVSDPALVAPLLFAVVLGW